MGLGLDSGVHYLEVCTYHSNHCFSSILSLSLKMSQPTSVHLVGSVPFSSAKEVFLKSIQALPNRLARIPDGETGSRDNFIAWQLFVFPPQVRGTHFRGGQQPQEERTDFECTLDHIRPTQYDVVALESYQTFCELRESGVIPQGVRFQVSLPTPINGTWNLVDFAHRERVEPLYAERLVQDMNRLQDAVPARDLAIQFDVAVEFAYLEYERGRLVEEAPIFKPYFSPVKEGVLRRIEALASAVRRDVQLGFHLCYGDRFHRHFVQPEDTGLLVDMATAIARQVGPRHPINWFHMPVPKNRADAAYFDPLKKLDIGDAGLVLGLVHAHDEEGTKERLKMAQAVYPHPFGVATECGMGRTPLEDIDSIFTICRNVTAPGILAR